MRREICFIYPWATFGGVERMLLNRAAAFASVNAPIRMNLHFQHNAGGLKHLTEAIGRLSLSGFCRIVETLPDDCDLFVAIDSEEAVNTLCTQRLRYIVECHTAYAENRTYLKRLPESCEKVLVPSAEFLKKIVMEHPRLSKRCELVRNFVPWDLLPNENRKEISLPGWHRRPILFLGRMDGLKNPSELLDAFEVIEAKRPGQFLLLFCGPIMPEFDLQKELKTRRLMSSCVYMPPVPFTSVQKLLRAIATRKGIFVSPSRDESFGLSAAEAISYGVPVVLSDIEAHRSLTGTHREAFTYALGDPKGLAARVFAVIDNYEYMLNAVSDLRKSLSSTSFLSDWNKLMTELKL
jgi:glycosyltransferase involved in cell wall biosynthesis